MSIDRTKPTGGRTDQNARSRQRSTAGWPPAVTTRGWPSVLVSTMSPGVLGSPGLDRDRQSDAVLRASASPCTNQGGSSVTGMENAVWGGTSILRTAFSMHAPSAGGPSTTTLRSAGRAPDSTWIITAPSGSSGGQQSSLIFLVSLLSAAFAGAADSVRRVAKPAADSAATAGLSFRSPPRKRRR